MKLVMAIMGNEDTPAVMEGLTDAKFQVTKLATTGGFLKAGNTTLIIGVEDVKVSKVIDIISKYSSKRVQTITNPASMYNANLVAMPFQITSGGAIIFVLNVEQFEKI